MKQIVTRFAVLGGGAVGMFVGGLLLAFRPGGGIAIPRRFATYLPTGATPLGSPLDDLLFVIGLVLLVLGFAAIVGWIGFEAGRTLRADATGSTPARRKS